MKKTGFVFRARIAKIFKKPGVGEYFGPIFTQICYFPANGQIQVPGGTQRMEQGSDADTGFHDACEQEF